jgi:hypothetical protein
MEIRYAFLCFLQALDRSHRLGQQRVCRLIAVRGTLEENVMGLQRFKWSIANTVPSAETASLDTINTEELLDPVSPHEVGVIGRFCRSRSVRFHSARFLAKQAPKQLSRWKRA